MTSASLVLVPERPVVDKVRHLAVGMGAPIDSHLGARRLGPYVALCGTRELLQLVRADNGRYSHYKACPACLDELETLHVAARVLAMDELEPNGRYGKLGHLGSATVIVRNDTDEPERIEPGNSVRAATNWSCRG
jgi:hypothetical protein